MDIILSLDFGSNSNKCLIATVNYKLQKKALLNKLILRIVYKNSFVHKIAKTKDIESYKNKFSKFFKKLKKEIKRLEKEHKVNKVMSLAVGTEFYRKENPLEIIKINTQFLKQLNIPFKVIDQKEESILVEKGIKIFYDDYIIIDMGGGSTEITFKKGKIYQKFLYQFGCLSNIFNDLSVINDFTSFFKNEQIKNKKINKVPLILVGGSFISFLSTLKKTKKFHKYFYKVDLRKVELFYSKIKDLSTSETKKSYPFLKDREESIKTALQFIILLLKSINREVFYISTLTLLEGLTIKILELNNHIKKHKKIVPIKFLRGI